MIAKIEAEKRHLAKHGWLTTYHLFSFADYYDPENVSFGTLRVFNDDTINLESGFGAHTHDNMEIVTIVLEGELTHKDSIGNTGVIKSGEVQHMSAGTGVTHAEVNASPKPVHLYQIWIYPNEFNIAPSYEQKDFRKASRLNTLLPVASGEGKENALSMHTDATIYTSELERGKTITHKLEAGRGAFIYIREGVLQVNDVVLEAGDQARIADEDMLTLGANEKAEFALIDVPITEEAET